MYKYRDGVMDCSFNLLPKLRSRYHQALPLEMRAFPRLRCEVQPLITRQINALGQL